MGDYKVVTHRDKGFELYDLSKDSGESNDIASKEPVIVARIEQYIKGTRTEPRAQIEPKKPKGRKYQ